MPPSAIPGTDRTRVGRSTARDWVDLHEAMEFEGLKPRPRSDRGSSRAIPEAVQGLLLALRPSWRCAWSIPGRLS